MGFFQFKKKKIFFHETGKDGNKPIMFLHGNMSNHKRFLPLIEFLKDDYRCYALDFPGSGLSEDIDSYHSIQTLSECASYLMSHIGGSDFVIVGHSMGGGIAQLTALENLTAVRSLVLINSISFKGFSDFYNQREYIASMFKNRNLLREIFDQSFPNYHDHDAIEEMINDAYNASQRVFTDEAKAMSEFNIETRVHNLTTPTLLLYSDNDQIVKADDISRMAHNLPNCKSVMLKGFGHSPHFEAPNIVYREVLKFILNLGL